MNGGFEVLENGSERHPDGAGAGSSFGILSGARGHPTQTQVISSWSRVFGEVLLHVEGASEELEDRFKFAP
jgi:hypothetical protein